MPRKRSHGEGSFYQTASGLWRGAITVREADGQVSRRYVSGRSKRAAMVAAAALRDRLARPPSPEPSSETVAQFLERWLRDSVAPTVRPSTHTVYSLNVRRLTACIGALRLAELRPADAERAYAALLARGLSRRSVEQAHTVLHTALEKAMDWELVTRNVTARVSVPRPTRTARAHCGRGGAAVKVAT